MMYNKNYLCIVIPIFNRFKEVLQLLEQLNAQSYQNFKVIIVDHGTEDFILDKSPYSFQIEIIKANSNLWFTGAINKGLEYVMNDTKASVQYVLIMNDDILIEDTNFIKKIFKEGSRSKIVSCMAVTRENKIIYAGIKLEKLRLRYKRVGKGKNLSDLSKDQEKVVCDVLPTRCTLFPIRVIKEIGFLNENRLPHYGSDYEWTNRAKTKGFQLIMINNIYVKTDINDKEVSGRKKYNKPVFFSFIKDLFNQYKRNNIHQIINYSFLVFRFPYNVIFSSYLISRKIIGFLIRNLILKAKG